MNGGALSDISGEVISSEGENQMMKERNKKLKAIEKELSIKHVTRKAPANKYAHVPLCHERERRTVCSVGAYGARVAHHFLSNS